MRLFIAINFENSIVNSLKQLQSSLKKCGLKGRYSSEENLHLTLAFIGEYDDPDKVLDVMEEVEFEEFSIEISGIGNFGTLYWTGVEDNPYLMDYAKRLRRNLADNRIPFDKKKYRPHVTLIRRGEFVNGRVRLPEEIPEMKMVVRSVSLVKSELTNNGSIYTVLGEIPCIENDVSL